MDAKQMGGGFQETRMGIAIPERVALSLPIAGLGPRCLAYLVDLGVFLLYWLVLLAAASAAQRLGLYERGNLGAAFIIVALLSTFGVQYVYWTVIEWRMQGQSIGKRAVGIRVVRRDGGPVRFLECAVRNLCRAVDFLPLAYGFGVLAMLFGKSPRRLGDLAAGTLVVRDEHVELGKYLGPETSQETGPAASKLTDEELELVLSFLHRCDAFDEAAFRLLAEGLLRRFEPSLPETELRALLDRRDAAKARLREHAGLTPLAAA